MNPSECLRVVMPVYNEANTVEEDIRKVVLEQPEGQELIAEIMHHRMTIGMFSGY
jgi:hypothetical protein